MLTFIITSMSNLHAQNNDYLFMVEQAVKAPSGHNTQPWLFKINEGSIEIHPNFEKSLPVVDPDNRELFISLGCAAENLCIAASLKGYTSRISVVDGGIVMVYLEKNKLTKYDTLFKQIAVRQTNRSVYSGKILSSETLAILKELLSETGITGYFYKNETDEFNLISTLVARGNTIQMQSKAFTDELKQWMRFNKKHQDKTNDGLSYAAFGAPNLPMFLVKPIMSGYLNDEKQNKGDAKRMQSSSHFVLLTVQDNTAEQWVNLGRAMERFLLKSTGLGVAHAYLNQPIEVKELAVEMTKALHLSGYPAILLRVGYGDRLPYSKRKEVEDVVLLGSID